MERQKLVFSAMDSHGLVEVKECGHRRNLYFGNEIVQSSINTLCPWQPVLEYIKCLSLAYYLPIAKDRILILGAGGGSLVNLGHYLFPEAVMDVVDHSPAVFKAAQSAMHFPDSANIHVHVESAFSFLKDSPKNVPYDLIFVDLFDDSGSSLELLELGFFQLASKVLSSSGVLGVNLWNHPKHTNSIINQQIATMYSHVPIRWKLPSGMNQVVFTSPHPFDKIFIQDWLERTYSQCQEIEDVESLVEHLESMLPYSCRS